MIKLKTLACSALMALTAIICTSAAPRTVDYPWIDYANTNTLDVAKVEVNDTATIVTFDAYYRPKYWIRIATDSYLKADGKKYALKGADGITPDALFWMPESGTASFKLIFEPLSDAVKEFDFIEGDTYDSFKLWGIKLSDQEYRSMFPAEVTGEIVDGELPAPKLEQGLTTIRFHLMPFCPDMPTGLNVYVNTIAAHQDEYHVNIDSDGNGTLSFEQYGPVSAAIVPDASRISAKINLQPGETVDCYIDMRMTGIQAMYRRKDFSREQYQQIAHTGVYNTLNRLNDSHSARFLMNLYTGDFADYHMSGREYIDMVKAQYDALSDSIAQSSDAAMLKEYQLMVLRNDVLEAMARHKYLMEHNYRNVHDTWNPMDPIPADSIPAQLSSSDYTEVAGWFDMTNPKLLLGGSQLGAMDWNRYGVKGDLSRSLHLFSEAAPRAARHELTSSELDSLHTLSNPLFATACDSINQRALREYERLSPQATITPTPDVADDLLFDTIIAPHKGKVVVVDLWNTWCGPCRAALKHHEPLKSYELSSDDIVWIYIADESSDPIQYVKMLPEIKGIHYKLTEEQIHTLGKRFKVDGIPFYILVDRQGNAEGRPDMRYDGTFIDAIKSKL